MLRACSWQDGCEGRRRLDLSVVRADDGVATAATSRRRPFRRVSATPHRRSRLSGGRRRVVFVLVVQPGRYGRRRGGRCPAERNTDGRRVRRRNIGRTDAASRRYRSSVLLRRRAQLTTVCNASRARTDGTVSLNGIPSEQKPLSSISPDITTQSVVDVRTKLSGSTA